MRIGIVGAGKIGKTLSRRLSAAGHDVKIANSRGPETIDPAALATGARAVDAADAVRDVDDGEIESVWHSQQIGRPIVKAWNAIGSASLADKGAPTGTPGRIAIPVAADARKLGMMLVDQTGFDGFDAGPLSESWRQQPGAPCYCTDLTSEQMGDALATAEMDRLPKRRDISIAAIAERVGDGTTNPDSDYAVRLTRALFM